MPFNGKRIRRAVWGAVRYEPAIQMNIRFQLGVQRLIALERGSNTSEPALLERFIGYADLGGSGRRARRPTPCKHHRATRYGEPILNLIVPVAWVTRDAKSTCNSKHIRLGERMSTIRKKEPPGHPQARNGRASGSGGRKVTTDDSPRSLKREKSSVVPAALVG
jgi:hypothetical protein